MINTDRLRQLAHCAADGAWSEFYMSIPPRQDHDADLVLSAAADEIDAMRAEIGALQLDARRYRWLIKKGVVIAATVGFVAERDGEAAIGSRIDAVMAEEGAL